MNINKLLGIMAENRYTQKKLADEIKMSANALNLKLTGKSMFNCD